MSAVGTSIQKLFSHFKILTSYILICYLYLGTTLYILNATETLVSYEAGN